MDRDNPMYCPSPAIDIGGASVRTLDTKLGGAEDHSRGIGEDRI
jgi:hypothetical protein